MIDALHTNEYTDVYFQKSHETLAVAKRNPVVVWQVFQKKDAVLAGLGLLQAAGFFRFAEEVHGLEDGDDIAPHEPVLVVKANVLNFIEFETVYLGILARCTRIATNVRQVVKAANGKPVLFFPARFDVAETQFYDGYAAAVGGAAGCATPMQTQGFNAFNHTFTKPVGTMPHALIAAMGGDTVAASLASTIARPEEPIWPLVDFENDCGRTAVEVFKAFQAKGIADRIAGVRLDTSEKLVDAGLQKNYNDQNANAGLPSLTGVCPSLVCHVRRELDNAGARDVKIAVSGGFNVTKVEYFERNRVPVDVYAVGESFLAGANPFTSDIVGRYEGNIMVPCGKIGRQLGSMARLKLLMGSPEAHLARVADTKG